MRIRTILNLKSRKTIDIENLVATAYRQGVLAGVAGARGEKITPQTVLKYPTASIRGSDAADNINCAMVIAIQSTPVSKITTDNLIKHYPIFNSSAIEG